MVIKWHGKIDRNRITFWLRGSQNCRFVPFGNKHYGVPLLCCDAEFSENKNGRTEFHSMNVVHVKRQPKHFGLNQHTSRKTKCVCTIWRMLHFLRMLLLFIDMNVFGVARGVFCFCRYCCYSRPSFWLSIVLAVLFRSSQQWAEWHQKVLFTLNSVTLSTPRRRHRHHHRQQTTHRNVLQTYTHTRARVPVFILIDAVFRTQNFPLLQQCRHFIELCTNIMLLVRVPRIRFTPPQSRSHSRTHTHTTESPHLPI